MKLLCLFVQMQFARGQSRDVEIRKSSEKWAWEMRQTMGERPVEEHTPVDA